MGFSVEISSQAKEMVRNLKTNPAKLFSKSFPGYLIFLFEIVDADDKNVYTWMKDHGMTLDRATGNEIAFALFSEKLEVSVREANRVNKRPWAMNSSERIDGSFTPKENEENYNIQRIVKEKIFGMVNDQKRICAVNKAVIDLATEFCVLGKLPCVIAIDGFPIAEGTSWEVFSLDEENLKKLRPAIFSALDEFRRNPNIEDYRTILEKLKNLGNEIEKICGDIEIAKSDKGLHDKTLHLLMNFIKQGDSIGLKNILSYIASQKDFESKEISGIFSESLPRFEKIYRFITEFGIGNTWQWPLVDKERDQVEDLIEGAWSDLIFVSDMNHIAEALESKKKFIEWRKNFIHSWNNSVKEVAKKIKSYFDNGYLNRITDARVFSEIEKVLNARREEFRSAINDLSTMENRPSWSAMMKKHLIGEETVESKPLKNLVDWVELDDFIEAIQYGNLHQLQKKINDLIARFGYEAINRRPKSFISYSSADKEEVLKRMQGMDALSWLELFRDEDNLRSGQEWKSQLEEAIKSSDIFFLFWSNHAANSENVKWEYCKALEYKREIRPIPLVSPIPDPPESLCHLHFRDRYCQMINPNVRIVDRRE